MISDSGRGFRKVVPSPAPLDLLEKDTIIRLFECGTIVISAGGGGVGRQNLFDCLVGLFQRLWGERVSCEGCLVEKTVLVMTFANFPKFTWFGFRPSSRVECRLRYLRES